MHSHSGYLDIAIALGWPALGRALVARVVRPVAADRRAPRPPPRARRRPVFLMVLGFMLLNSFLESYLFKRADPCWMLTFIAVAGLRLLQRTRIVRPKAATAS